MASSSRFASKSETQFPTTPAPKRRRRDDADTKPRHSQTQENSRGRKGHRPTSSRFEWPFPRREREGYSPPRKSQRHSVDRFFESRSGREYPPPYQHQNTSIHGSGSPRSHARWRRRSLPQRSMRRHSERRNHDANPEADCEPALPPSVSPNSRDGIEREWNRIRQAQEQIKKDRQALERDRTAHEAKVRYELEQLGREIEEERRRVQQRKHGGGYYGCFPHSPPSEEVMVDDGEEEGYHDSWFGGYDYPPDDVYWGMDGRPPAPDYEDEDEDDEDGNDEQSFAGWESDDEPAFAQSAYRSYFQSPPRYSYDDYEESQQTWAEDAPSYHEQPDCSRQKCEEMKKAYDAYIGKWKSMPATASSIPFPTTDLTSALLLTQPEINMDVPLSEDQTIEVNSTLFFLLAFDLQPNTNLNSAGTPKIEIGPQADLEKVKALQKQMKIERVRWHPDSLVKRRLDGMVEEMGSKGVYRAVDELLEECKGRLAGV